MEIQARVRDKDALARELGWFSIALGTAQIAAPGAMCRVVGAEPDGSAPSVMRLMGVREVAVGTAILARPRPTAWLWSRVAGDVLDLALLGVVAARHRRARTGLAIAQVAAVTVADVAEARFMSERRGPVRGAMLVCKAVTIDRPVEEVRRAWEDTPELRRKIGETGATVRIVDAPGDRGAEVVVELTLESRAGDLGLAADKLRGRDLPTQLSDDLRCFKQQVETGRVVRSEGSPDGHLLADHLRQRAAQPLEEAVR
jgi:uncharacterized membrane protein